MTLVERDSRSRSLRVAIREHVRPDRGVNGVYHHVSRAHVDRYLAEFGFRYKSRHVTDARRTLAALSQAGGQRLRYREAGA
jgi:hypothetical protein